MKLKQITTIMTVTVIATVLGIAGCGTDAATAGVERQNKAADKETGYETAVDDKAPVDKGASADSENPLDNNEDGKTEVRREDYRDCDGSGHGYVEIYYSDGSMETEEY